MSHQTEAPIRRAQPWQIAQPRTGGSARQRLGVGFWPFWESLRTDVGARPEQAQDIVAALLTASLSQRS